MKIMSCQGGLAWSLPALRYWYKCAWFIGVDAHEELHAVVEGYESAPGRVAGNMLELLLCFCSVIFSTVFSP